MQQSCFANVYSWPSQYPLPSPSSVSYVSHLDGRQQCHCSAQRCGMRWSCCVVHLWRFSSPARCLQEGFGYQKCLGTVHILEKHSIFFKHICMYVCIYIYIFTYIHYTHTYIHTYMHAYIHTYKHIHTCKHTYIYTYIHTYIHIYIYTLKYVYIYKYTFSIFIYIYVII